MKRTPMLVMGALLAGLAFIFNSCSSSSDSGGAAPGVGAGNPPEVLNVVPGKGPKQGGITVVIKGENFLDDPTEPERLKVLFGLEDCQDVLVHSSTEIRVLLPAGNPGTVDVKVINDNGQEFIAQGAFTYVDDSYPLLDSISPASGPNYGLTKVTLHGHNFESGATVRFGGTPSQSVKVIDSNTIETLSPYGPAGTVSIQVESLKHQVSTLPLAFTYQDSFRISGTSFQCDLDLLNPGQTAHHINVPITVEFNRSLEPTSVTSNSFILKTSKGKAATGKVVVNDNQITFFPDVKFVGSSVVFGFVKGSIYKLEIPGVGTSSTVRAKGGVPLQRGLVWELNTNLSALDFNNAKPKMSLQVPKLSNPLVEEAKLDTDIVVAFDEVVMPNDLTDPTAIVFEVEVKGYSSRLPVTGKRTPGTDPLTGGSFVKFEPDNLLPAKSKVWITADPNKLHDVVGKTLDPSTSTLNFLTESGKGYQDRLIEDFATNTKLDWEHTGAIWGGGKLVPGRLGGTGELGDLVVSSGTLTLNTDYQLFNANQTLTGKAITVTDGLFQFASLNLAAGTVLKFSGSKPARLMVRGSMNINGTIDLKGSNGAVYSSIGSKGGAGGAGGAGGGAGGAGGNKPFNGLTKGADGGSLGVPTGHPRRSQASGTGGIGSLPCPNTNGVADPAKVTYVVYQFYSQQVAGGGGGGSFMTAGTGGTAKVQNAPFTEAGPGGKAGAIFPILPLASATPSSDQMPIGGSGGGGGGIQPLYSFTPTPDWKTGGGGGGGGGGLLLQAGGDFTMGTPGRIDCMGGDGSSATNASPGGGGSGGSVLMQIGRLFSFKGAVNVTGGLGKTVSENLLTYATTSSGRGGEGFILVEKNPAVPLAQLTGFTPGAYAANTALLTEVNPVTAAQSTWYDTRQIQAKWLYYLVKVKQGSQTFYYSDNPAHPDITSLGATLPQIGQTAVAVFLQGTILDANSKPGTISPWFSKADDLNNVTPKPLATRFCMVLDKSKLPSSQSLEIEEFKVVYNLGE